MSEDIKYGKTGSGPFRQVASRWIGYTRVRRIYENFLKFIPTRTVTAVPNQNNWIILKHCIVIL